MANIYITGAGLVGSAMAIDLKKNGHLVCALDADILKLEKLEKNFGIKGIKADFNNRDFIIRTIEDADLIVGACPGEYGYRMIQSVIEAGKNMVDISFCPEDYMELDNAAKEKGVTIVTDIGVAPGMCNVILGYHDSKMEVDSYKCIVGGLPVKREWPLEYKASWSPIDVIEEYTRPARFKRNGVLVTKPALSDVESVNIEPIGTLEEWNSDGLRSLLKTMPHIPDLLEKTLRYPGTVEYLKVLRELGFFSPDKMDINGTEVSPLEITAGLLFPKWKLESGEKEFTVMRVTVNGMEGDELMEYTYELYDEYHTETATLSMARTTGYTCTGAAELLLSGKYSNPGINPPEFLGRNEENFRFLLKYLEEREVFYRLNKKRLK